MISMKIDRIAKSSQEQAVASWINYLNQSRLDSLMKGLQSEQVNFENATDMIDRTLKIIENDIVNNGKGRGGQKECMDLLQRLRNVELEMLEVKLQEKHRSMNGSMIMGQKI